MKRLLSYILIICLMAASFLCNANASDSQSDNNSGSLRDVLRDTNHDLLSDILDASHYDKSMQNVNLDNESMLLIYNVDFHAYAKDNLNEIIEYVHDNALADIVILNEDPVLLREYLHKTKIGVAPAYTSVPTYIEEILNGESVQYFVGASCRIVNVICFDAQTSHKGTTVVFETDNGNFVRYYENDTAVATEFTWDEYVEYAIAYYEYATSYEQNYNASGEALIGGNVSFLQFCENPSQYSNTNISSGTEQPLTFLLITFIVVGVCLLCCFRMKSR